LLAISSAFKVLFGRVLPSPYRHLGLTRSPGRGESNPVLGAVGDRSATSASPLWLWSAAVPGPQNKGAASLRKRLLDGPGTFESPGHLVKGASVWRLASAMAWLAYPCLDTDSQRRDVNGVRTPSKRRASRHVVTSMYRTVNNIHRFDDVWEESMSSFL
jgi:hypothetical protein